MRIICPAISVHPIVPDLLWVFKYTRMLKDAGWLCTVTKERTAIFLHCQRCAKGILHHGNRRKTNQTIESQSRNMQYFIPLKDDVFVMLTRHFIGIGVVGIEQVAVFRPVDLYVFRKKGIEPKDAVFAVPHDLCIGIAPQKQVHHHGFPKGKTRHLRIRLPVQDLIQRMVRRTLLPVTLFGKPIKVER